jgi:hypothetical protein
MEIVQAGRRKNKEKEKDNTKTADKLRSWVQIPPGPSLSI